MARYKDYSYEQTKLIPVSYDKQIIEGTFEYALNEIISEIDLSIFESMYRNDETGAPAYDTAQRHAVSGMEDEMPGVRTEVKMHAGTECGDAVGGYFPHAARDTREIHEEDD